jgi:hypothetical protein
VNNPGDGSPQTDQSGSGPNGAWVLFVVFGLLITAHGLYMIVLRSVEPDHWRFYTSDPDVVGYLVDAFRASGAMEMAVGALTIVVAMRWFRAGDPWAWWAFCIFPALFVWGVLTTWAVVLWLALFLAAVATLAAGTYSQFFRGPDHARPPRDQASATAAQTTRRALRRSLRESAPDRR